MLCGLNIVVIEIQNHYFLSFNQRKSVLVDHSENGVINVGNNQKLVFKIESHNHPSAIEPFQGAATGVGGILRDIFTMGARPIAVLNSLRFGNPEKTSNVDLLRSCIWYCTLWKLCRCANYWW